MPRNEFAEEVAAIVAAETKKSRYRDSCSGERIHPIKADIRTVIYTISGYRVTRERVHELAGLGLRVLRHCDTRALRALALHGLETRGNWRVREACRRCIGYCNDIENALKLRDAIRQLEAEIHKRQEEESYDSH